MNEDATMRPPAAPTILSTVLTMRGTSEESEEKPFKMPLAAWTALFRKVLPQAAWTLGVVFGHRRPRSWHVDVGQSGHPPPP